MTDALGFDQTNEPDPTMERLSFFSEEEGGCLYHDCGRTRIKVHEHFAPHGKALPDLMKT